MFPLESFKESIKKLCYIEIKFILGHLNISKSVSPFMYYSVNGPVATLSLKFAAWD